MAERTRYARHGEPMAFIQEAAASSTDECIIWPYARSTAGYGRVAVGRRLVQAHRLTLELASGAPADGRVEAAHAPEICHNRACVNPRHLRWATRVDNFADKAQDGTETIGTRNGSAKLSPDQVRAIRADRRPERAIAMDYPVSRATINEIKARKIWAWLD